MEYTESLSPLGPLLSIPAACSSRIAARVIGLLTLARRINVRRHLDRVRDTACA
jgi:hypothetical protein